MDAVLVVVAYGRVCTRAGFSSSFLSTFPSCLATCRLVRPRFSFSSLTDPLCDPSGLSFFRILRIIESVVSMSSRCLPADHITDVIQLLLPDRRNQIWKNRLKIEYRDETVSLWFRLHSSSSSSSSCPVSFFRFGNSRCRPLRVSCVRNHLLLSRQKCNCPAGDLERKERD